MPIQAVESPSLIIEYKNSQPVEVLDFANSLFAIADEYKKYVSSTGSDDRQQEEAEVKLYVKELRNGSLVAELAPYYSALTPVISDIRSVNDFAGHIKGCFDFLLSKTSKKDLSKSTLDNINSFVEPIAKDSASQININVNGNNNKVLVLTTSSLEANAIQNSAKRELANSKVPVQQSYEKVLLVWHQVRNATVSNRGDRAIVEAISQKPYKCVFQNESVKAAILSNEDNLFKLAFLVDVMVERIRGKIALYKIMGLYEVISLDDVDNADETLTP